MFWKKKLTLDRFLSKYDKISEKDFFATGKLMDRFPHNTKGYTSQLQALIDQNIHTENPERLDVYLALAWRDGIDESYIPRFKKMVLARWHNCHEDIIDYIYDFKNDTFTEDIYTIATDPTYRDGDELDAVLRKCVHALKTIDSENARAKITLLENTGDANVKSILDMYRSSR